MLRRGNKSCYVQEVPFQTFSIENYGLEHHSAQGNILIQSERMEESSGRIFYNLKTPAKEYKRYHHGFLWLADLAKHFIDYGQDILSPVETGSFRTDFASWITEKHGHSTEFNNWFQSYGRNDFRSAIAANIEFLHQEAIKFDKERFGNQPVFAELFHLSAIPKQQITEKKTVVTPYVYHCFSHMAFADHLKSCPIDKSVRNRWRNNLRQRKFVDIQLQSTCERLESKSHQRCRKPITDDEIKKIKIGDILAVIKDEVSAWKDEPSEWRETDEYWYIYVQGIRTDNKGKRSFDGIWLYRPSDTICAMMKYPFPNELFFSDNCTCLTGRIPEDEIIHIEIVDFHISRSHERLFIRQTYLDCEKFVTFDERHKICQHLPNDIHHIKRYAIGESVLARARHSSCLEAFEVIGYERGELGLDVAILKKLPRRAEIESNSLARPNELVYGDEIERVSVARIKSSCHVRFYTEDIVQKNSVPVPYSRDGTGNFFYITTRLIKDGDLIKLQPINNSPPQSLVQGFDPLVPSELPPMRSLDLCHGSGNFGRGVAEGGAVINEYACDSSSVASHTYYINDPNPSKTKIYSGSMDDYLRIALKGNPKNSDLIALPGDIDHLSAGSPCEGFSTLNNTRGSLKSRKKQSLIASVAAHIDFYRPRYGLIENVLTMANKGNGRHRDVLSQLICTLVGLGYQLQVFLLDAWSCGSPQSRSRIFISFVAPGLHPLDYPAVSHSHPKTIENRSIGIMNCGQSFGNRIRCPTPLKFVDAITSTRDLPDIGDGHPRQCIRFPDHITAKKLTNKGYAQIDAIPTFPRGLSFWSAWDGGDGVMTQEQRVLFPHSTFESGAIRESVAKGSRAWGRVHPKKLFPTVVSSCVMEDSRMGTCLHWDQPRHLTIQEARRAQGFPDHEVLAGRPSQKMQLVGDAVARQVALALGLATRDAIFRSRAGIDGSPVAQPSFIDKEGDGRTSSGGFTDEQLLAVTRGALDRKREREKAEPTNDRSHVSKKLKHLPLLPSNKRYRWSRKIIDSSSDSETDVVILETEISSSTHKAPRVVIDLTSDRDDE